MRIALFQFLTAFLVLVVALAVPELRRSIPALYTRGARGLSTIDVLLFVAVMSTWSMGAQRLLVEYPLIKWNGAFYDIFEMSDHAPVVGSTFVLYFLLAATLIAPFVEELLFRGFLLNLLIHRWGLWPGVLLSSFVFGLGHFQNVVAASVSGVFLAMVYLRFGSLWQSTSCIPCRI